MYFCVPIGDEEFVVRRVSSYSLIFYGVPGKIYVELFCCWCSC